jgi:hypothetical protein
MTDSPVLFVGTPELVAHQALPLQGLLDLETIAPRDFLARLREGGVRSGAVCLFINEHFPEYREAITAAQEVDCPTLYVSDGITEWRSCWESEYPPEIWKPILCHKAACVGDSQARILESWGNWGKCEVVGSPRLDALIGRQPRQREAGQPVRILIMTAKRPGFRDSQRKLAVQSLRDLKAWFEKNPSVDGIGLQPVWRLTKELDRLVGVENSLNSLTGGDLAAALLEVDAVITTPSTTMLEGMMQGLPTVLLDYNNCPHYVPAVWNITAPGHCDQIVPQRVNAPEAKLLYQTDILHDALECCTPATPRFVGLVEAMEQIGRDCILANKPLQFPTRICIQWRRQPGGPAFPRSRTGPGIASPGTQNGPA